MCEYTLRKDDIFSQLDIHLFDNMKKTGLCIFGIFSSYLPVAASLLHGILRKDMQLIPGQDLV